MERILCLVEAALGMALLSFPLHADPYGNALVPTSGAVNGAEMGQLRNYGRQVGQDWLKDTLGFDVQSMQLVWDPQTWRFVSAGSLSAHAKVQDSASSVSAPAGVMGDLDDLVGRNISVRLVQTDGMNNFGAGLMTGVVRDIPYGVEIRSELRPMQALAALDTRLSIPLSPDDDWRANVSLPVNIADGDQRPWWWRDLGLGRKVALRTGINSRLGLNQVETGMRTQWSPGFGGLWDLDYAWQVRYGENSGETSNWLKFSRGF